nr:RNA-binding motif protein, X-linked-like-2 [Taeniopygia guttata]
MGAGRGGWRRIARGGGGGCGRSGHSLPPPPPPPPAAPARPRRAAPPAGRRRQRGGGAEGRSLRGTGSSRRAPAGRTRRIWGISANPGRLERLSGEVTLRSWAGNSVRPGTRITAHER